MKYFRLFLAILLIAALLAACGKTGEDVPEPEPASAGDSQPEPADEPEPEPSSASEGEDSEPEPEPEPVPEPAADDQPYTPPTQPAEGEGTDFRADFAQNPADFITFHIVDEAGNPVPYVAGGLEITGGDGASGWVSYSGLTSMEPLPTDGRKVEDHYFYSDANGDLFLRVDAGGSSLLGGTATLQLRAYYDSSVNQQVTVNMPQAAPATFTITWKHPHPPSALPPQTTGVRFLIVDREGNPVPGITMMGTDYPKEHEGPVPEIAGPFIGPTGEDGVIRWDGDFEAGTYAISFYREGVEGASMSYELKHPGGKALQENTITWD